MGKYVQFIVMKHLIPRFCGLILVIFLAGCATPGQSPIVEEPEKTVEEAPTVAEESPLEAVEPEEETPEQAVEEEAFTVTGEVYERTFQDIEDLISNLNTIIQSQDYETWISFLSEAYIERYSDPEVLNELSRQPLLQKYDIELSSLRDYFTYVVVPSRSNVRLDDLVFEDEHHVKAIMLVNGQRTILYQLVYIDNRWKIGV